MKRLLKKSLPVLAILIMFGGTLSVGVMAHEAHVHGGVWQYGTSGFSWYGKVWSNYWHTEKWHSSTAIGALTFYSGDSKPWSWALAEGQRRPSGNQSYYNVW